MASTVEQLTGILHSDTIQAGKTPKAGDMVSNFQQNMDKINEVIVEQNLLVGESTANTANITAEETARLTADVVLTDADTAMDYRVSILEESGARVLAFGVGAAELLDSSLPYAVIAKTATGSVRVNDPATYTDISDGKRWRILNTGSSGSSVTVTVDGVAGYGVGVKFHLIGGESVVLVHYSGTWSVEAAPGSVVFIEKTSDASIDGSFFFQPIWLSYNGSGGHTIKLPPVPASFLGHRILVTNMNTASGLTIEVDDIATEVVVGANGNVTSFNLASHHSSTMLRWGTSTWVLEI